MNLYIYNVNLWQIFYEYFPSSKNIEQKELSKAFRPVLNGAGSLQRGDGEHRQRAGHKHFLHAERRAAGGDGRYKGADAGPGYLAKKFRTVKVKLKAGYKVMLYAKEQ